jgi:hypothetical protein
MLRRWARGALVTLIVGIVVVGAVMPAAQPVARLLDGSAVSLDLGALRLELRLGERAKSIMLGIDLKGAAR